MPTIKDLALGHTAGLLRVNGEDDARRGISMHDGWTEICKNMGFSPGRTPAREAYEDGYYSVTAKA